MKKILIVGVSDVIGGIETLFKGLFIEKSPYFDITFLCFDRPCAFSDIYKSLGYKIDIIQSRKKNPLRFSKNVKKYFHEHNEFDYVWINTSSASIWQFQFFAKKYTKAKVITHSHGTEFEKTGSWLIYFGNYFLHHLFLKRVISNTDMFFCCSKAAGIALFGRKQENKLIVINNGIDSSKYAYSDIFRKNIRKEFKIDEDELLKNPIRAINIFNNIYKINNKAKLIIVGTGELLPQVNKEVNNLKISDKVILTGLRSDVNKIYSALDILIMPSFFEGLPLTVVESQCSGLRCVLSDSITKEVAFTDLVSFVPLSSEDSIWSKNILSLKIPLEREKYLNLVRLQGYDIEDTKKKVVSILYGNN